jgi:putative DNA primase/helicase
MSQADDFNDVLRREDEEGVRSRLDKAVPFDADPDKKPNGADAQKGDSRPLPNGKAAEAKPGAPGTGGASADGIVSRVASSIKPEPVTWIWPQRIPRGKLSILGGHPGEGKTLLSTYMAAVVSTGGRWPDGPMAEAGNVIILSGEDDPADTILPRLIAHGADLSRIHILEAVRVEGQERWFSLIEDLPRLEQKLAEIGGASLMIVDVIDSYIGTTTNSHRNADVRRVLGPLKDVAARHRMAVLGLTHFSKSVQERAVLRFTGSIGSVRPVRVGS